MNFKHSSFTLSYTTVDFYSTDEVSLHPPIYHVSNLNA